ncbi:CBL-interacting serine/threonine-protein kinase 25-like isoform X1 [Hibiscus syriacus]|uniref:CBL-interacting serine/threonine-protein kinase 25-like isoform X1 n=1 Tax=Hibiscus syriacus TaxID=106335 RepID=UPI001923CAEA|nr:CBL-interacting serine/threonine-protein kinase 25-like isoform X1 [Hibiscus syriacus]
MFKKNGSRKIVFGKFEMGRVLGQGTFAKVYYGKNLSTQESVAIKVINKEQVKKEGLMEQIKREIAIMRLVRHPNVVELKEVMATKAKIFFVMEYVKGGELFAKVAKGKLKEDSARKYFQQLVSSVEFCHSRGVYHRDLKPENLLLDENENLKVADFGLSALPEQLRNDGLLHTQCGTPSYVAPEVLRKNVYDGAKADVWSCGVILFVLLAGYLPFQAENLMKMYRKVFKADYEFPPWVSNDARRLISKLLVADPEKRITIPGIIANSWFRKGFSKPVAVLVQESSSVENGDEDEIETDGNFEKETMTISSSPPPFYNAFKLISSMSSGFGLSNLFEDEKKTPIFTSKCSASATLARLESMAKKLNFKVLATKGFKVKMLGKVGRKGRLAVTAEVFELASEVTVVELSKFAGDTLEYNKFYVEELRPALKDIVWTWQGENK